MSLLEICVVLKRVLCVASLAVALTAAVGIRASVGSAGCSTGGHAAGRD